jgi:hypothetical protein
MFPLRSYAITALPAAGNTQRNTLRLRVLDELNPRIKGCILYENAGAVADPAGLT